MRGRAPGRARPCPPLTRRVAVITGACSDIGYAIANLFAHEGASTGIIDVDAAKVEAAADVREVKAAIRAIVAALGEVNILVNNIGMDTTSPVESMSTEMFDDMIRVHLKDTFLCTREVIPAMRRKGWGRIIKLSSRICCVERRSVSG